MVNVVYYAVLQCLSSLLELIVLICGLPIVLNGFPVIVHFPCFLKMCLFVNVEILRPLEQYHTVMMAIVCSMFTVT